MLEHYNVASLFYFYNRLALVECHARGELHNQKSVASASSKSSVQTTYKVKALALLVRFQLGLVPETCVGDAGVETPHT